MSTSSTSQATKAWDYTDQAAYYRFRPNYAEKAIDDVCAYVNAKADQFVVADVGAGTGNLTVMLLARQLPCIAIEPNDAMRTIGIESTKEFEHISWRTGTGEHTTLDDASVDWFAMGSSFNTTDREATLKEAHRVLKPGGYFSCMWNHRDLEDPIQKRIEDIILSIVPTYQRGTRREGQADIILSSKLFNDVHYIEQPQQVERTLEEYMNGWKSVKNIYWDHETEQGKQTFKAIEDAVKKEFGHLDKLHLTYVTRIWTARVQK
ncbi:methyltransferase domain-containing protein [Patescibacteria group bacterium]|nr:methyltransferase domain-containing protein [Patescibacteria group bacterium]